MSAHTPGPWAIRKGLSPSVICTANPAAAVRRVRGLAFPQVAMVVGLPEERPAGEWEANGRLIAAAPDMLALLEELAAGPNLSNADTRGERQAGRNQWLLTMREKARALVSAVEGA